MKAEKQPIGLAKIQPHELEDYEVLISAFYDRQPNSFYPLYEKSDVMQMLRHGLWSAYIVTEGLEIFGLFMVSVKRVTESVTVLYIEMTSCQDFFKMAQVYRVLEQLAREMKCDFIEGVAHHAIANYACRKHDYRAYGVAIRKPVNVRRMN